jgi:hypothetical protein
VFEFETISWGHQTNIAAEQQTGGRLLARLSAMTSEKAEFMEEALSPLTEFVLIFQIGLR